MVGQGLIEMMKGEEGNEGGNRVPSPSEGGRRGWG